MHSSKKLVKSPEEMNRIKSSMKRQVALVRSGKNAVTRDALQQNLEVKNASLTSFRNKLILGFQTAFTLLSEKQ